MATLRVDGENLVLHMRWREKALGFHADIRAPLSSVLSVRVLSNPWLELRGWRMAGIAIPAFFAYGTRRHGTGYDFTVIRRMEPVVEVELSSGRFQRLFVSVGSADRATSLASQVAAAAGIRVSEAG
jgi:hypothetical protein